MSFIADGFSIPFALAILFLIILLPLIALIDILRSEFRNANDKLVWVVVVIFFPFLGAILYFVLGKDQKIHRI